MHIEHYAARRPQAVLLTFSHPFDATELMAQAVAQALSLNGYRVTVAVLGRPDFQEKLSALTDPELDLVLNLGVTTIALTNQHQQTVWEMVPKTTRVGWLILDALPYDLKSGAAQKFIRDFATQDNLFMVSFEQNSARVMTELTGRSVIYVPTGAYLVPPIQHAPKYPDRLMFWGSVETELGKTAETSDVLAALRGANPWGLDEPRLTRLAERLMYSDESYTLNTLASETNVGIADMLRQGWIEELCRIDSAIKRFRRLLLVRSLKGFPLDLYGKNWEPYVEGWRDVRICQASPDQNIAFGHICQNYRGVVNVDPNWGWGTNERVITALTLGIPVLTNRNRRVDGIPWCHQYVFSESSIVQGAHALLASTPAGHAIPDSTWEHAMASLLRSLASATPATLAPKGT